MGKICERLENGGISTIYAKFNVTLLYDGVSKKVANILERTF